MGQSGVLARKSTQRRQKPKAAAAPQLSLFTTELGWFGVLGAGRKILSLAIGHATAGEVRQSIQHKSSELLDSLDFEESDWNPDLRRRLQQFTLGKSTSFSNWELDLSSRTAFQRRVISVVRRIKFGTTKTYGEIAADAGAPRAARAVGTVMASNQTPIVVPCHRVVAAGGRLGGFSAPNGVNLKLRMLELENIKLT